jgi:hypothetical protein
MDVEHTPSAFPLPADTVQCRRYAVRWDAARNGYAIFDPQAGAWLNGYPSFGKEHIAQDMADALNRRDVICQRESWLDRQRQPQDS